MSYFSQYKDKTMDQLKEMAAIREKEVGASPSKPPTNSTNTNSDYATVTVSTTSNSVTVNIGMKFGK